MNKEMFELSPVEPYGPVEPLHPKDPGDYPPDYHKKYWEMI